MIGGVHGYVQFAHGSDVIGRVEDSIGSGRLKAPCPLLCVHAHRLIGRRHGLLDVVPNENRGHENDDVAEDYQNVRNRDPTVQLFFVSCDVPRRTPVLRAKLENEPEEDRFRDDQPKTNQRPDQKEQVIDAMRIRGSCCEIPLQHLGSGYRIKINTATTKATTLNITIQKTVLASWSADGVACSMGYFSPNLIPAGPSPRRQPAPAKATA